MAAVDSRRRIAVGKSVTLVRRPMMAGKKRRKKGRRKRRKKEV